MPSPGAGPCLLKFFKISGLGQGWWTVLRVSAKTVGNILSCVENVLMIFPICAQIADNFLRSAFACGKPYSSDILAPLVAPGCCLSGQPLRLAQVLTLRLLMSYIYGAPILDVSRSHTTTHLRPLTCWDRGFESHRGHGYLSVVSVVCCQVEVSATSRSLVQRSPTDCGVGLCVI
jgi:hypothetical protein